MPEGWDSLTIQDLIDRGEAELKTGPFGTQLKASDYVASGTPVINVRNIGFGGVREEKLEYLDEETVDRLSSHLLQPGDIVFGRKGAVERHVFIQPKQDQWFQGSDCLRLRLNSPLLLPRYVSYSFLTERHQEWMKKQCSHGATMASLNQDIVSRIPLEVPPIAVQREIVSVLSAYDDLIENNIRRIAILEEMAQAIYREWFVHFRFPGHEAVEFVDTEVGEVPAGWEVVKLPRVAEINRANVQKQSAPEQIHYINISSVSPGRIDEVETMEFEEAPSRARRIVQHGDTIWSTVRPNRRSYALVVEPIPNTVASTGFAVLTPVKVPFTYLYYAVTTDAFADYLANRASGSAYPAVNVSDFKKAEVLLPSMQLTEKFHGVTLPLIQLKENLLKKNEVLSATRNLLLPRLVSGDLNLSNVEVSAEKHKYSVN